MKIQFVGVGEAFEPDLGNTSYLLRSESTLLIDCGYAVPRNLFTIEGNPNAIDAAYFTHFHADHTFGVPALINRWNEDGRNKPLTIIGQQGIREYINQVIDLGYSSCRKNLNYELNYVETTKEYRFNELVLSFAKTDHGKSNYAIKISKGNVSLGISGDGGLTTDTRSLFQNCQYLIHEAFGYEDAVKGHTTALEVLEYARTIQQLKVLALVHIQRHEREERAVDYSKLDERVTFKVMIPNPEDIIFLSS